MIVAYMDLRDLGPAELDLLPDSERGRRFGSERRRRQFQCGRALARLLLQEVTGRPAPGHEIIAEEGGKPYCSDGPAFSITHSTTTVVACVSEAGLVGVDAEEIDENRNVSRIVDRFFSADEAAAIASNPESFYMLWVLKEAFVKAHGQSIYGGLQKLRCAIDPPSIRAEADEGTFQGLSLYRRGGTFLGLAATEDDLGDVEFRYWSPLTGALEPGTDYRFIAATRKPA